jgi:hypothetical protein
MKQLILILAALLALSALAAQPYAQTLFFSEYVEGSSNNKALEIFNGTGAAVDLSQYTVKLGSNGGAWSTTNILTPTGTLAHNDVFVIANAGASAAILAVSDVTSTVTYYNGDDCLGLFQGDTLIDIIGVYQTDPGTAWPVAGVADATLNHTLIRKPTVVQGNLDWIASAGTTTENSEWIVQAQDYITDLGMHTFTPGGGNNVATPVFTPGGGIYTAPVSVSISCATTGASIYYTTDGSTPTPSSTPYTAPINISATTTLKAVGVLPGMDNSLIAMAVYTFPVNVANLTALRASPADGTTVYRLTGEAVLTFQQSFRNQKFLQDGGAGILIDDFGGVITTQYNIGDGITGLMGKISEYAGMLQFVPTQNGPAASSTNNPIVPLVVNFDQLVNGFETYESRVVKVMEVFFTNPTGNFANGTVYACYDQDTDYNIRTSFYDVDYINTAIPTTAKNITGIPTSRTEGNFFTPRWLSDFEDPAGTVSAPTFNPPGGVFFAPVSVSMSCATAGADIHYTLDGSNPTANAPMYTAPITLNATTTVKAIAILDDLPPSAISSATYSFPISVGNLTALRQSALNGVYRVSGEVLLSFQQSNRHQKFVQDAGAGILIDDPNGVITTAYSIGDGITNLTGTLSEYGGMLEFTPAQDPGAPSSTGNAITPIMLGLEDFINEFEDYESRLVKLTGVHFMNPGANFATGTAYQIQDAAGENTANFRTNFYDSDYIGVAIPIWELNLTGIPNSRTDGNYFTARMIADFQIAEMLTPPVFNGSVLGGGSVSITAGFITPNNSTLPYQLEDIRIYRNGTMIAHAGMPVLELTYTDSEVLAPGTYSYYATAVYTSGESEPTESFVHAVTSNPDDSPEVAANALLGNWPNPFNPSTGISFALKEAGTVRIDIFNARGQLVRNLVNGNLASGTHTAVWDGADNAGATVSSGVYYYRMYKGSYSSTRKMLMLK